MLLRDCRTAIILTNLKKLKKIKKFIKFLCRQINACNSGGTYTSGINSQFSTVM